MRGSGELFVKGRENPRSALDENDPGVRGIHPPKIGSQRETPQLSDGTRQFHPCRSRTDQYESQQILMLLWIMLDFRDLERSQDAVADRRRVFQAFQTGRKVRELLVAKIIVRRPCRENENTSANCRVRLDRAVNFLRQAAESLHHLSSSLFSTTRPLPLSNCSRLQNAGSERFEFIRRSSPHHP